MNIVIAILILLTYILLIYTLVMIKIGGSIPPSLSAQADTINTPYIIYYLQTINLIKVMKKIFYFIMICLAAFGAIGGIGYTIYCHAYVISVGVAGLAFMAFPTIKNYVKKLTEQYIKF